MTRNIVIVGVGALGSHVALLSRNFDARIKLVDFDRVEQKNTLSQFHTKMGLGRNKAQALAQTLQGLFGLKVEAIPHRLTADNAEALLGGADLVIDCLDNGASRRVVQETVRRLGVPCLHGGLAADGQFGRAIWDAHFVIDDESEAGQATCEGGEHLPFIAVVAARLACCAQAFLATGAQPGFHIHPAGAALLS